MRREEVLNVLALHRDELRRQNDVASLLLFGSVARGESTEGSDVDLLVEFGQPPGFDGYMSLKFRLEEILGCRVDLVMEKALKPHARPAVEREGIRVA